MRILIGLILTVLTSRVLRSPNYPPAPVTAASPDYRYLIGPLGHGQHHRVAQPRAVGNRTGASRRAYLDTAGRRHSGAWPQPGRARARPREGTGQIHSRPAGHASSSPVSPERPAEQIRIVGEAAKPQAIPYRQNMTLLDVMIVVGGLTDFADGNKAVLVRGAEKGKQYSVRLGDLVRRGDISANVDVRPGDVLIIPQSWF